MNKGKYLAIDFGDKRVGIAISDLDKAIAFPRDFLTYSHLSDLSKQIAMLCEQESVVKIIIGLPIQMDGTMGDRVKKTIEFGDRLKQTIHNVSIDYFDERLTTQQAIHRMQAQGTKAKNQKPFTDSLSAQVILETYLSQYRKGL
ncbi:Holliday junction resolvase RuvX [Candidatus Peregrinibacteria bacterium CG_4_10_14_0_2_um_filter_43_11]|nr:MAG: Holliday junction resolvase RuvX [Candidatus Peregrinibacteria bacterium CG_4_10_14_0_2_um_filter_43_11]